MTRKDLRIFVSKAKDAAELVNNSDGKAFLFEPEIAASMVARGESDEIWVRMSDLPKMVKASKTRLMRAFRSGALPVYGDRINAERYENCCVRLDQLMWWMAENRVRFRD